MMPSKYAIAKHWREEYLAHVTGPAPTVILDSPACFACGYYSAAWDKGTDNERWQRAILERAHIVARSAGGSDTDPDNFMLLCHDCHAAAPMTTSRDIMLKWVRARKNFATSITEQLIDNAAALGVTEDDLRRECKRDVDRELLLDIAASLNAGIHFGDFGPSMSPGTYAAVLRQYIDVREGRLPRPAPRQVAEPEEPEDSDKPTTVIHNWMLSDFIGYPVKVPSTPKTGCIDTMHIVYGACEKCNEGVRKEREGYRRRLNWLEGIKCLPPGTDPVNAYIAQIHARR